jgi:hypothetical protein
MTLKDHDTPAEAQSAFDRLTEYKQMWLTSTLAECQGFELARLIALTKVSDLHALRQGGLPLPNIDPARSVRICHGADILLPQLMARIDPATVMKHGDTTPKLIRWATEVLEQAGALLFAHRAARVDEYSLTACQIVSDDLITIELGQADLEAQENRDRNDVNDWDRVQEVSLRTQALACWKKQCQKHALSSSGWRGHLEIFLKEDPFLDASRALIEMNAREYVESESFPDSVQLGPLTFGQWKDVAVGIAAHFQIGIHCATSACNRAGPHDLMNSLPRFLDTNSARRLIMVCSSAVTDLAVDQVLDVFAADGDDVERFKDRFMPPSAMLLKVPRGFAISHTGQVGNPFWYMTEKLKLLFKDEWMNAAAKSNLRESIFRDELYSVLGQRAYGAGKNLTLKRANGTTATDIDAVFYERATNVVYLVQLKWPEVSVGEWRRRQSEFSHLSKDGLKWINEVQAWLELHRSLSNREVLSRLELDGLVTSPETVRFELVVISRSWTRFSGKDALDNRAAWTSWTRLRKLLIQHRESDSPLRDAWSELCNPEAPRPPATRTSIVQLPNLTLHFKLPL